MRLLVRCGVSLAAAFVIAIFAYAAGDAPQSNSWIAVGDLNVARANAASVLLDDGRVLVTGGRTVDGSLRSAELFTPAAGFRAAGEMLSERSGHAAVKLLDGHVLVTGGVAADGMAVNSAEIYDPSTNDWHAVSASMSEARAGHTATLLGDGRVLIAGGDVAGVPSSTFEVYDPNLDEFRVAGVLSAPRMQHAAALLADGRVLIAGGTDGNVPLASVDVLDADAGWVGQATMAEARTGLTATTLLDGKVLVAGGANATGELTSAEVFDPATGSFTPTDNTLTAARRNHLAFLLPHNNQVLIVGGLADRNAVATAEYFTPWEGANGTFCAAPVCASGYAGPAAPATARAWATASALSFPASATNRSGPGDGLFLLAGGSGQRSAELLGFATVKTDKDDYAPGTTVTITGSGWQPYESVALVLVEQPLLDTHPLLDVTADGNGNIISTEFKPDIHDLNVRFMLTAYGTASQAQTTFTDAFNYNTTTTLTALTSPLTPSQADVAFSGQVSVTGTDPEVPNGAPVTLNYWVGPTCGGVGNAIPAASATTTSSNGSFSGTFTAPSTAGTYSFRALFSTFSVASGSSGQNWQGSTSTCQLIVVNAASSTTTTAIASSANPSTYGQSVTFTATVQSTSTPTGSVNFIIDGGSPVPGAAGATTSTIATWTYTTSALTATTHTVAASYVHTGSFQDSSGSLSGGQVVNKATATVVVTPYTVTYDGQAHTAAVTSITGVNGETGATVGSVDVSNTTHTSAGTFADSWSFTGAANYNNIAATAITDTINKATATVVVTPYNATYDGQAHTATVASITGVNGETGATVGSVDVSNTTHTNAGTFADSWSFTGAANYNNIAATAITDTINKATATVVVTPYNATYDGQAHTATVASITGVNGETGATVGSVDVSNTTHTNAGTFADSWSFTGAANYHNIAATAITDTINKATATVVVTPYNATYDGQAHTATVASITGVNGETGATVGSVDVSNTTHTNAGTFADTWSFTGAANYNNIAATAITDTINKATATVVVTPYNATYDGQAHTATVASITGVNGETGATVGSVDVSNTTHTNAGTFADTWSFTGAANYNNIAATAITDTINKATATVVVTPYNVTFDANPHTATYSITGVGTDTAAVGTSINVSATTHTTAGTYNGDTWSFTGGTNYNDASGTVNDAIGKATATVVVTPYNVTFDANPHTATYSITGVGTDTAAVGTSINVSATTHTTAGTYNGDTWSFTGGTNYNDASGTVNDAIGKATATVVVTPYSVTFDANPHTATYSITGVGTDTAAVGTSINVSATTHTTAGTYNGDTWSFTGGTNYNDASGTVNDAIGKASSTTVVNCPASVTYTGAALTPCTASSSGVGGLSGSLTPTYSNNVYPGTATANASYTGDVNHNGSNAVAATFTIGYGVCSAGYGPGGVILQPINSDGTSVYSRKGGSTIPVKFTVCDAAGMPISNVAAVFAGGSAGALTMLSAVRGTVDVITEPGIAEIPDVAFRWSGDKWIFNMATSNLVAGTTYTFRINLAGGSIQFRVGVK